jgi:Ca2+-binding RTX toxin-like protein
MSGNVNDSTAGFSSETASSERQGIWSSLGNAISQAWTNVGTQVTAVGVTGFAGGVIGEGVGYGVCYVGTVAITKNPITGASIASFCADAGKWAGRAGGVILGNEIANVINSSADGGVVASHRNGPDDILHSLGWHNDGGGNKSWVYGLNDSDNSQDQVITWHTNQLSAAGRMTITSMDIKGTDIGDRISGNDLGNLISGGLGKDIMHGLSGRDTIIGGANDDSLFGGAGADTLLGGSGSDLYHGGSGADHFNISILDAAPDTIDDFAIGEDILVAGGVHVVSFKTSHDSVYKGQPNALTYVTSMVLNSGDKITLDRANGEHLYDNHPTLAQVESLLQNEMLA